MQHASSGRLIASHLAVNIAVNHSFFRVLTMSDDAQAEQSLFFAGSDDGRDDGLEYITPPLPARPSESAQPPSSPQPQVDPLFFADSEAEDEPIVSKEPSPMNVSRASSVDAVVGMDAMDVDPARTPEVVSGRASSVASVTSIPPLVAASRAESVLQEQKEEPPRKKRKLTPEAVGDSGIASAYLGSFLVGNAWSTVRGKGFIKVCNSVCQSVLYI